MSSVILAMIGAVIGALLFIAAIVLLVLYFLANKGRLVRSLILLGISIVLMGGTFIYLFVLLISKSEAENNGYQTKKVLTGHNTLSKKQKKILDTKTFEECNQDEISLIMRAVTSELDEDEIVKYEPKIKKFYIKYFESMGYKEEEANNFYNMTKNKAD